MNRFWMQRAPFVIALVIVGVFVFGQLTMLLWNAVIPVVFHLPLIDFWQALGLFALSKILFGSFRGVPRPYWGNRARRKWMDMTPEQREKFNEDWGRRCGGPYRREERPTARHTAEDQGGPL